MTQTDKIVISLLKLAEEELAGARWVYEKGIYHKSLFLFQQSVEKAYKAFALDTRQIFLTDLKKVGHDYIKLLQISLTGLPEEMRYKIIEDSTNKLYENEIESGEIIYSALMNLDRADFFDMTEERLFHILEVITKYKELSIKIDPSLIKEIVVKSNKLSQNEKIEFLDKHEKGYDEEELKTQAMFHTQGLILQLLGLLTSPHSEQTRYPLKYNDYKCPTEIYKLDLPIIKHQMTLMEMADEAIKFIKLHCP